MLLILLDAKQIAVMNNTQKGWKNKDFLKHFSQIKIVLNIKKFKFIEEYKLPFRVNIALLSDRAINNDNNVANRGPMPSFRNGSFNIVDLDKAKETASRLIELKSFVPNLVRIFKFSELKK